MGVSSDVRPPRAEKILQRGNVNEIGINITSKGSRERREGGEFPKGGEHTAWGAGARLAPPI